MHTSIEPWLSVRNGYNALAFYKSAFGAEETYRLDGPENSFVVKLSIGGAGFWLDGGGETGTAPESPGGGNVRLILITGNPESLFDRAVAAGARVIFPVGEEHGWKLGRIEDPFGLHWEIGHPVSSH